MSNEEMSPLQKKDELQKKANQLRKERDRLNDEARAHAEERDVYNGKVRELVNEANEHKKRRDEQNEAVRRQKDVRDEANGIADESAKKADALRRERMPDATDDVNVPKLKKEARALEYQQMTSVLKPSKERSLVERLQEIGKLIRAKDKALKADPELKAAIDQADALKEKAEKTHTKVGELAERAQSEHDSMIKLYKESDKLRKTADKLQEKFVVSKMEADKIHKAYIEFVNQIHEIEDGMGGGSGRPSAGETKRVEAAAEEVYERFKNGSKLSTEDLLMLQKAGLL
jgi:uncharacterized coiled-coil DUF342 family protein